MIFACKLEATTVIDVVPENSKETEARIKKAFAEVPVQYEHREKEDNFNKMDDPNFNPKDTASGKESIVQKRKKGELYYSLPSNYDEKAEYDTIMAYIQDKFKRVDKEEAEEISESLVKYGKEHDLDPKFAAALIARESGFNKKAVSRTGAKGLGQIKDFNFKSLEISDPFSIKENIRGTTKYIRELIGNWENPKKKQSVVNADTESDRIRLALASYFKGPGAVRREGVDAKSHEYVDDILKYYYDISSHKKSESLDILK